MVSEYTEVWPDTAVHPGEHIQDFFDDDATIPVRDIADVAGLDERDVRGVIDGDVRITHELAEGLSRALRTTASFWINLQEHHDEVVQRLEENMRFDMEPYQDFTRSTSGISPIKYLVDSGVVPRRYNKIEQARFLCVWLGIPNLEGYENRILGQFQLSNSRFSPKPAPLVVWLRRGELEARQQIENIADYNENAFLESVRRIRGLTTEPTDVFLGAMREACNGAGVAFVASPNMPGCGIRGVARWLDDSTPMIQLNDYGNAADRAWFTFYHEVAHILKRDEEYLDLEEPDGDWDADSIPDAEQLANQFAEDILIPERQWKEFATQVSNGHRKGDWIERARAFAARQGIHPSIVVGRLMKERLVPDGRGWWAYNKLKQPFKLG